jgi:hypothetical protein
MPSRCPAHSVTRLINTDTLGSAVQGIRPKSYAHSQMSAKGLNRGTNSKDSEDHEGTEGHGKRFTFTKTPWTSRS